MKATRTRLGAVIAALAFTVVGCTKPGGDPSMLSVPADPQAALAIVTPQPRADHADVEALVTGSARTDEHVEIVSSFGKVLGTGSAPAPPVMAGPTPSPSLPSNPTNFQVHAHQRQEAVYTAKLAADRRALARSLTSRLSAWAAKMTDAMTQAADGDETDPGPGIAAATTFFASLQQAGLNLGPRRVMVIYGASGPPDGMPLLPTGSLSGVTVILADFQGSLRAQEEWQAYLLQAGAARAIVLVPSAADELIQVTQQGLAGQVGPAPVDVYFGLNQASLEPAARTVLRRVAAELTTTYPDAVVTILGFADPLGNAVRNAHLSADRALAVKAFLVGSGVAATRVSAAGYGTDLPAAPSQADGVQPLDRRAIVVIDPVEPFDAN